MQVQVAAAANISSDQEECLHLLNLKLAEAVRPRRNEFGDQGFINEVYLWERLDLGLAHNTIVHLLRHRTPTVRPAAVDLGAARRTPERLFARFSGRPWSNLLVASKTLILSTILNRCSGQT